MVDHMLGGHLANRQVACLTDESYPDRIVGYVRVSTVEQTLDLQMDAMRRAGVPEEMIFQDLESGRTFQRDGLRNALKACRRGGQLLVWKLDRLGRNTVEIIRTVDRLREWGVHFRSLTESMITTDSRQTPAGKLLFAIFAALAEFESDQVSERTRAGIQAAKARGVLFGRQGFEAQYMATGRVEKFQAEWARRKLEGATIKEVLADLKIPRSTYLKYRDIFMAGPVDDIGTDELS